MKLSNISFLALFSVFVCAQDIDENDVPIQCRSICASVTSLTETCDRQNNDDDSGFINCVCSATNAATEIPACEACVANYDTNDGHDNDVNDLVRSCSFTTTSFSSGTTTSSSTTAMTSSSNGAGTTSSGSMTSRTDTAGGFTIQTSLPTATSTTSQTSVGVSTNPSATPTPGAGNVNELPSQMGLAAAVFLGAAALL